MSRQYSRTDEENVRDQSLVRDWLRSGLLDPQQADSFQGELQVHLRRVQVVLRVILFLFTSLIIGASTALAAVVLHLREDGYALLFAASALTCFGIASLIVKQWRLYRCGVEEAFAVTSVVFASLSVGFLTQSMGMPELASLLAVLTAAIGSFALYRWFGFRYAALMAVVLSGVAPFVLDASPTSERALAGLILLLIFSRARDRHTLYHQEVFGPDYEAMQTAAWAGIYVVLNQQLSWFGMEQVSGWAYWASWVLVWILPAAGLWLGIRDRERSMIDASAIMALVSIATNKSYLGWQRQTWDPMLFGILLIGVAIALRRWLANGNGGEREGFTPMKVLESQDRELTVANIASASVPSPVINTPKSDPGGGRSGGAGASGDF